MPEKDWVFQRTAGLRDYETSGLRDYGTTGLWDYGIMGLRDIAGDARVIFAGAVS